MDLDPAGGLVDMFRRHDRRLRRGLAFNADTSARSPTDAAVRANRPPPRQVSPPGDEHLHHIGTTKRVLLNDRLIAELRPAVHPKGLVHLGPGRNTSS